MSKKVKKKNNRKLKKALLILLGIALIVSALVVWLSVFSYHDQDPTFNNQNGSDVKNLLGVFGANLSCAVFSLSGIVFPVFAAGWIVWGYNLVRLQTVMEYKSRILALCVGVCSGAVFLNIVSTVKFFGYPLGGILAQKAASYLLTRVNKLSVPYGRYVVSALLLVMTLMALNLVLGITLKDWRFLMQKTGSALKKTVGISFGVLAYIFGLLRTPKHGKSVKVKQEPTFVKVDKNEEKVEIKQPEKKSNDLKTKPERKNTKAGDDYQYPDINLLSRPKDKGGNEMSQKELEATARQLEEVLQEFGINGKIVHVRPGPVVTLYELEPAAGTKTARVIGLADDIARSMSAVSVRIAVVPGSNTIGIEMPNVRRETVWLKDLLADRAFKETKNTLNIVLGKDIGGRNTYADLAKMPHLLVAGTTGSGKSVGVNSMILSLLYRLRPDECKLIMIDPKMLEFSMYNGIPHLLTPVITDPAKAVVGLKWAVREMEERYRKMAQLNVRNITGYNQKLKELSEKGEKLTRTIQVGFDPETGQPVYEEQPIDTQLLPYIVIVVDEMADLMLVAGKEVEAAIQRLAQMARAAGLHLIMSTQRPSVDVITGTIKANFPSRISFQVTSKIDSRTILGEQGAEQLLGMGDMLYMPAGLRPLRVHGSFVKDSEVEAVVEFLKNQGSPQYVEAVTEGEINSKDSSVFDNTAMGGSAEEDLYMQAVAIVRNDKKASTSYIQRKLRIGYNRAAALIDRMEEEGIVSAADHVGRREILS